MKKRIPPFNERVKLNHPTLKFHEAYEPVLPSEVLYGIDYDRLHEDYEEEDANRIEKEKAAAEAFIEKYPKLAIQRIDRQYEPYIGVIPRDLVGILDSERRYLNRILKAEHKEEGLFNRIAREDPAAYENLTEEEVSERLSAAIQRVANKDKPMFSLSDTGHVLGELAKGFGREVAGRGKEAWELGKAVLPDISMEQALEKGRQAYENTSGPYDIFKPSRSMDPTIFGEKVLSGAETIGEGLSWLTGKGAQGITAAARPFISDPTANILERASKEGLDIGLALAPLAGKGVGMLRGKPRGLPSEGLSRVKPSALEPMLDAVAKAENIEEVVKASELHPHLERPAPPEGATPLEQASKILGESEVAAADPSILDKIKSWGAKTQSNVKEFFDPFSSIPDREVYEAERGAWKGLESSINRVAQPIIQDIKSVTPDARRNIYRAIENGDGTGLSAKELEIYNTVVTSNDLLGSSLVKRGYMPQADFEELKGKYIPRTYLDNFFEQQGGASGETVGGGVQMDTSLLKDRVRKDYDTRLAHGLVEDVGVGFEKHVKDTAKIISADNILNAVVGNPKWVWKDSFITIGKDALEDKISLQQLPKVIETQKKVIDSMPMDTRGPAQERLTALEKAYAENKSSVPPVDFKLVPDTPGYGPLRGLYVNKAIADDLVGFFTPVDELKNQSQIVKSIGNAAQNAVAFWKVTKTVLNVPSWMRNFGEAAVRLNLSGVRFYDLPGLYGSALYEMKTGGKLFREAQARGLLQTTFSDAELKPATALINGWLKQPKNDMISMMCDGADNVTKSLPKNIGRWTGELAAKALAFSSRVYQSGDSLMVLAKYIAERKGGKSAQAAFEGTVPWAMDYSIASPAIKASRKFVTPFISYPYKVAPVLLKALKEHPEAYVKYTMLPWVFANVMDRNSSDLTTDECASVISMYPDMVRQLGNPVLLSARTPTGNLTVAPMDYILPWGPFASAISGALRGDLRAAVGITTLGNPIFDLASLVATSRGGKIYDMFTGKPLYNPYDSTMSKIMKVSGSIAERTLLPGFLTSTGALGKGMAVAFKTEYAKRNDLSWRDVWLSLMGVTTRNISPLIQQRNIANAKDECMKEWAYYVKTNNDDEERFNELQTAHRERMLLLEHPDARKPAGVDPDLYRRATLIGPDTGELTDKLIREMANKKEHYDNYLFNLPIEEITGKSKKALAK